MPRRPSGRPIDAQSLAAIQMSPRTSYIMEDGPGGMTLQQIADQMNLTRERVRQIEAAALAKLRAECAKRNLDPSDFIECLGGSQWLTRTSH